MSVVDWQWSELIIAIASAILGWLTGRKWPTNRE